MFPSLSAGAIANVAATATAAPVPSTVTAATAAYFSAAVTTTASMFNVSVTTIVSTKSLSLTKRASLQVVRRQWRTVVADTMIKSDGKR